MLINLKIDFWKGLKVNTLVNSCNNHFLFDFLYFLIPPKYAYFNEN